MTKLRGRDLFYGWYHKETGERLGKEVFSSRIRAQKWFDDTYYRYNKFPRIDDYFRTLRTAAVAKFSRRYWYRDKEITENYEIRPGHLDVFELDYRGRDKNIEQWKRDNWEKWNDSPRPVEDIPNAIQKVGNQLQVKFEWRGGVFDLGFFRKRGNAEQALDSKLREIGAWAK